MPSSLDTRARPAAPVPPALVFASHPDRNSALSEAHARPSLPIHVPTTIHHLAFQAADLATARDLFAAVTGADAFSGGARHTIIVRDGLTIKIEPHLEFTTLTLASTAGKAAGEALLRELAARVSDGAGLLVSLRLWVVPKATADLHTDEIGGLVRGDIEVSSSFRIGEDGFLEIRVAAPPMGAEQLGRRIQRVLEVETYRTMTLLGLPVARRIGPDLSALEAELATVTAVLTEGQGGDEEILDRLQALSARTEAMRSATRFRFSASRAYAALVDERVAALGERKVGERPTLTGFVLARLKPAVRTIVSTEARQEELSLAVGRALDLLRTRVDVSMNRGNQEILRSMNERQHRQLVLSEAVESLSVIAISYYFIGLLSYPVKALEELGLLPVSEIGALAILAPFVALLVWGALRRLRARWVD